MPSKMKEPTSDEMIQHRSTLAMYKSNLFKLQIQELIGQVSVKVPSSVEELLFKIREIIQSCPEVAESSLEQISKAYKDIPFPSPVPSFDTNLKFAFSKPVNIAVVGSFMLKTLAKTAGGYNIDMTVEMPDSLFQEKDHLNFRYFYKRAVYCAVLRKHLESCNLQVQIEYFNGDLKRPVLVLAAGILKLKL